MGMFVVLLSLSFSVISAHGDETCAQNEPRPEKGGVSMLQARSQRGLEIEVMSDNDGVCDQRVAKKKASILQLEIARGIVKQTGLGDSAALNAQGFHDVTSLCCPHEMEGFFNRLLIKRGYDVCSKPHVQGLMHWFSCTPEMDFGYVLDVIENGNPCKFWAPIGETCPELSAACAGHWCDDADADVETTTRSTTTKKTTSKTTTESPTTTEATTTEATTTEATTTEATTTEATTTEATTTEATTTEATTTEATTTEATTTEATTTEATTTEATTTEVTTTEATTTAPSEPKDVCAGVSFTSVGTGKCRVQGPFNQAETTIQASPFVNGTCCLDETCTNYKVPGKGPGGVIYPNATNDPDCIVYNGTSLLTVEGLCKQACCSDDNCLGYAVRWMGPDGLAGEVNDPIHEAFGAQHPNCLVYTKRPEIPVNSTISGISDKIGRWEYSECMARD